MIKIIKSARFNGKNLKKNFLLKNIVHHVADPTGWKEFHIHHFLLFYKINLLY